MRKPPQRFRETNDVVKAKAAGFRLPNLRGAPRRNPHARWSSSSRHRPKITLPKLKFMEGSE